MREVLAALVALAAAAGSARCEAPAAPGGEVTRYVDPAQQTAVWFGARSHWLQPWRAYLETPPTSRLRGAVGINLNVEPNQADAVCRHLAAHGFRHVRLEFGWGSVAWDHPEALADPARFNTLVAACKRHGLRPLFLLNAHHGVPCPTRFFSIRLTEPADQGALHLRVDPADVAHLVPGRSGLANVTEYKACEVLFTSVAADGVVRLSRPLPGALPAGPTPAGTLKFLPFWTAPKAGEVATPEFEETMQGWLSYVETIATAAQRALGTEGKSDAGFDLEVWNELTFGSDFLNIDNYHQPAIARGEMAWAEILRRTVTRVTDPARGWPGVKVSDGFNNQWPWGAGSTAPRGLAALGKHPYAGIRRFPQDQGEPNGIRPVDALGQPDGVQEAPGRWRDAFIPLYVSHFPEYFLTAIQTEHLVRDLSPIVTDVYGVKHGRATAPPGPDGKPGRPPELWITEVNLDPSGADPGDLEAYRAGGREPAAPAMGPADADRMKAKALLRYLVAYANKGAARLYFYAARDPNPMGLGLVSASFLEAAARAGGADPGDTGALVSPAMQAVRRLVASMPQGRISRARSLALLRVGERHGHVQFAGDPATKGQTPNPRPDLHNRDVLGFFPFQVDDARFAVGLYVMTRNMGRLYRPGAPARDPTRFDLPEERYQLTIGGLAGTRTRATLIDPLLGREVPLRIVGAGADRLVVDVPLTDSPRILRLSESAPPRRSRVTAPRTGAARPPGPPASR